MDPEKSDQTEKAERERKRREAKEASKQLYRAPKLSKFGPVKELTGVSAS